MELNKVFAKYFIPSNDTLNENRAVCSKCDGQCCKSMGCHISPSDLREISVDSIISLMEETNCIAIDWYEGSPIDEHDHNPYYYLRIKNVGSSMIDPSWGGTCSLLGDDGCPILFQYRPRGARRLEPGTNSKKDCKDGYTKKQCAIDWMPYREILSKIYDHYEALGLVSRTSKLDGMTPEAASLFEFAQAMLSDLKKLGGLNN